MSTQEVIVPSFDYDEINNSAENSDMSNKLFCTFSNKEQLESVIDSIQSTYRIIYDKIFILSAEEQGEYLCTYNVDFGNVNGFLQNTILVHRKKQTNTLYTINALNTLICNLNSGVLDLNYRINWTDYRDSILLTKDNEFKRIPTRLHSIINL